MSVKPVSLTVKMDHRTSRLKLDLRVLQYSDTKFMGALEVMEMKVNRENKSLRNSVILHEPISRGANRGTIEVRGSFFLSPPFPSPGPRPPFL